MTSRHKALSLLLGAMGCANSSDDQAPEGAAGQRESPDTGGLSGTPSGGAPNDQGGVGGRVDLGGGGPTSGGTITGGAGSSNGGKNTGGTPLATGGAAGSAGGTTGPGGGGGTDGGAGGESGSGEPGQGGPFVPEGIEVEYVGAGPSGGLEIVAFTLVQSAGSFDEPTFFVAVENTGPDPICSVDVPSAFFDASGNELASTIGTGSLASPLYDSFGVPTRCLGTGDIGMGAITLDLGDLVVSEVARIEHGFYGNIDPDAVELAGVSVTTSIEMPFEDDWQVAGTFTNQSGRNVEDPEVTVFLVDPAGRPYGELHAIDLILVPSGSSWDFMTTHSEEEPVDVVSFVDYDWP